MFNDESRDNKANESPISDLTQSNMEERFQKQQEIIDNQGKQIATLLEMITVIKTSTGMKMDTLIKLM
jgi:predicted secreted protein